MLGERESCDRLIVSSRGMGKRSELIHSAPASSLISPPCPAHYSFSLALSESEQCLSQIRELIGSMPKPNHDTLRYLLEHLCRSGRLHIFVQAGRGYGGHAAETLFRWGRKGNT